jgi:ATP-dependent Clp protease ATP-binding subunit ClpA
VTIELTEAATKWLGERGYDEKFGARPLARVIQEHIKRPLADELLFGKLENGGAVKVTVDGEGDAAKLAFEFFPADPTKKARSPEDEEDDEDEREPEKALIEAAPRKALPGPKEGGSRRPRAGTVPSVPKPKDTD